MLITYKRLINKKYIYKTIAQLDKNLFMGEIQPIKTSLCSKEIHTFVHALNKVIDHLQTKLKIAQDFNLNVSHELRTPLTRLKTDLEYFLYYKSPHSELTNTILFFINEVNNLEKITTQMLSISNNNIEKLHHEMQKVFLHKILFEVLENRSDALSQKALHVQTDISKAISLHGHPELLKHALSNIIDNAIKYSYKNQQIHITIREKNKKIYFLVTDKGIGIEKRDKKFIFHPYYRGKNTSHKFMGNGLGLSLSAWILTLHNADIKVHSTPNKGTTILIKFHLY